MSETMDAWVKTTFGIDPHGYPGEGGPGAGAAGDGAIGAPRAKKLTPAQEIEELKADRDEKTKINVILIASDALHHAYEELGIAIEKWAGERRAQIGQLKPHQTPTGGGLFMAIATNLNSLAGFAFPEFKIIGYAGTALGLGDKVRNTIAGNQAEDDADSAQEVKEAQTRADAELDKLVADSHEQVIQSQDKIRAAIDGEMRKADPAKLRELNKMGTNQYDAIRKFLAENFKIARGTNVDPGVIKSTVAGLNKTFATWMKEDFQARHLPKLLKQAAGEGSVQKRFLLELFTQYVSEDPDAHAKVKARIDVAEKQYEKEFGLKWGYAKELDKMVKKINEQYDDVYGGGG